MSKTKRFVGAGLACWVAVTGASIGQAQAPPPPRQEREVLPPVRDDKRAPDVQERQRTTGVEVRPTEGVRASEAPARQSHKAKSVLGSKVSIQEGLVIGTVDDIIFNDDGYIDYLVVLNEGKYVLVPWEAAKFDFAKRTASVEITPERFREVPTFTQERWPNVYDPAYRVQVYGYYGLKPGAERRLERREGLRRR